MSDISNFNGFLELEEELKGYLAKAEKPLEILEKGAEALVKDALKLPKPKSAIRTSGYTHLIDSFAYRVTDKDVEVGWGKYYGPMVENGAYIKPPHTKKRYFRQNAHLKPLFEKNKEKYYNLMLKEFYN